MAQKKPGVGLTREELGYVEFGSEAHRALLGIDREKDPEKKAALEEQLKVDPKNPPIVSKTKPINRQNYRPQSRRERGDDIFDGWRRQGR